MAPAVQKSSWRETDRFYRWPSVHTATKGVRIVMRSLRQAATALVVVALPIFTLLVATPAQANFNTDAGVATQFVVLGQFSNNTTNFNNGTINGAVGIGSPRNFTISNPTLPGNIRFSGAGTTSAVVLSGPIKNGS